MHFYSSERYMQFVDTSPITLSKHSLTKTKMAGMDNSIVIDHRICLQIHVDLGFHHPASILHKSISDRYRPDSNAVGPITVRYRLKQNASWALTCLEGIFFFSFFFFFFFFCVSQSTRCHCLCHVIYAWSNPALLRYINGQSNGLIINKLIRPTLPNAHVINLLLLKDFDPA